MGWKREGEKPPYPPTGGEFGADKKLIFLDVDGTLSIPINKVPASAKKACLAARKAGNLLFLSTGRAFAEISPKILSIGFDGVICSGGAQIYIGEELVYTAFFEKATLEKISSLLNKRGIAYVYEAPNMVINCGSFDKSVNKLAKRGLVGFFMSMGMRSFFKKILVDPPEDSAWQNAVCKIVFICEDKAVVEALFHELANECELFHSSISFIPGGEIGPKGIHKGAAVQFVAQRLGIARDNIFAFGDSDNDRTMLQAAGTGIAMGNAVQAMKALADFVTDDVTRDGLAKAFEKFGLVHPGPT